MPNTTKSGRRVDARVSAAPVSAPVIVNISRNMPILRFVIRSRTYADAAPLEVAITETALIAIARLMSTPSRVSTGTRTTPPPMPLIAPTKPAVTETAKTTPNDSGIGSARAVRDHRARTERNADRERARGGAVDGTTTRDAQGEAAGREDVVSARHLASSTTSCRYVA